MTLQAWLDTLPPEIQWIEYASEDGDYSGRISLSRLREAGEAILPPVALVLKAGRSRHRWTPETAAAPDPQQATAQALVTMTSAMRDLSAQVITQSRLAVQFQQDSAAAHIDLLRVHNEFVADHAQFMLGSAAEIGAHAASVAAQSRGDGGVVREVVTALGEVWGPYLLGRGSQSAAAEEGEFSAEDIGALHDAVFAHAGHTPLSDALGPLRGSRVKASALRRIFEPHKEWLQANALHVAATLPRDLVMRLRALT